MTCTPKVTLRFYCILINCNLIKIQGINLSVLVALKIIGSWNQYLLANNIFSSKLNSNPKGKQRIFQVLSSDFWGTW